MFFVHLQIQSILREVIPTGFLYNIPLFIFTLLLSVVVFVVLEQMRRVKSLRFVYWAY